MERPCTRREVLGAVAALAACAVAGCQDNKIPLAEFPKGTAPPPAAKAAPPPQGASTSQGEPPH